MTTPWITVIGVGADGLGGLGSAARRALAGADLVVGGERHQAMIGAGDVRADAERMTWNCGIDKTAQRITEWRGRPVAVLVTGDPLNFGAGSTLARHFGADDMTVLPHPGAFSLACARMIWSVPDVATMTVHGRALTAINRHLRPGARIVALSWNGETPQALAEILTARGFGPSRITVFAEMGAPSEKRFENRADDWSHGVVPDLNTVCIECVAGPDARWWSRVPGLPEEAFEHDSQITKREVRAATLAALGPIPGEMLWDIGAGSGSVAIEWLRAVEGTCAVAIESKAERVSNIRTNADNLGVPHLAVVEGEAPGALDGLDTPDAVFVGGGLTVPGLIEQAFGALRPGGRLVANAVTIEGQNMLQSWGATVGTTVTRLSVARARAVGGRTALRPMMDVVQIRAEKP
ncbi:MAG: precorrin-6y C5,15-methyltransferase (decarboxylating) subunit CbiE [Rhodospirillales bacterium]